MRCAQGFFWLPFPFKDIEKAKECSEKALLFAPNNPMAYYMRGRLYENVIDYENAKKYYEKAGKLGAYGAIWNLIRLECLEV